MSGTVNTGRVKWFNTRGYGFVITLMEVIIQIFSFIIQVSRQKMVFTVPFIKVNTLNTQSQLILKIRYARVM